MRWRWLDLGALPALACLTEAFWLSGLVALIAGLSWPIMLGMTLAVMTVPAAVSVAGRAARLGTRRSRLIVGLTALGGVAALIVSQSPASIGRLAGLAVADMLFVVVASWLAIRIGAAPLGVDEALGRAARGFGLVFVVLLLARLAQQPFTAAGAAVTGVVAAAALLVALARWGESLAMTDRRYGVSGWTWFAGIVATIAGILLVAGVLGALVHGAPLAWVFSAILDGLRSLLHAVAFVAASVAYAVLRAASWVLGLFHLHRPGWLQHPHTPAIQVPAMPRVASPGRSGPTLLGNVALPLLAALAGGVLLFLLVHAVRRVTAGHSPGPFEERESLISTADLLGSAHRRLSRLVGRLPRRQAAPASPAESVRRQFALLERSLATLGWPRRPGQTARLYLLGAGGLHGALPGGPHEALPGPLRETPPDGPREASAAAPAAAPGAADPREALIRTYETARYSQHPVSWQDAADFGSLARLYLESARAHAQQIGDGRAGSSGA
jgi:hypothetical protein